MQVTCDKASLLIICEKQQEQTLANNTKVLKLYLASLLPTVQDDNIQESMETFLPTVQEPFYPLQRNIQEFHNIRGASKNSIMTGSPLPSSCLCICLIQKKSRQWYVEVSDQIVRIAKHLQNSTHTDPMPHPSP